MVMTKILLPVDQKSSSEPLLIKSLIKEMSRSIRCRHSFKTCSSNTRKANLSKNIIVSQYECFQEKRSAGLVF